MKISPHLFQNCHRSTITLLTLLLVSSGGCSKSPENKPESLGNKTETNGQQPSAPTAPSGKPGEKGDSTAPKTYKLTGVIREIQKESGQVMIRHEEIPGFMKAMTMPFDLKGQEVLDDLFVGDEVEGTLIVKADDISLKDLVITNPAPPSAINIGPNGVEIKAKPPVLIPGEKVPDMAVTLQDGKTARISDYKGQFLVLTFVYTRCPLPNFCPLMDRKFNELSARLRGTPREKTVRLLSISFDPEHDTPEILTSHAKARGARMPLWTYAVASHAELSRFGPQFGLIYGPGEKEIMHNLCTAVISPEGDLLRLDYGSKGGAWSTDDILQTIAEATKSSK